MNRHLKNVLIRAKKSEFYKTHLPEKNTFWKDIPLTTKEHLRKSYPFGMKAVQKNKIVSFHESSGALGDIKMTESQLQLREFETLPQPSSCRLIDFKGHGHRFGHCHSCS